MAENIYLERQVSYFFKATLPLKPGTIALKIGRLAFQVRVTVTGIEKKTPTKIGVMTHPHFIVTW